MRNDPEKFKELVHERFETIDSKMIERFLFSLRRQIVAIDKLHQRGMYFFDYGNAFLLTAKRAGAQVGGTDDKHCIRFKYPSYFQDIMGDIFSLGFGPFR